MKKGEKKGNKKVENWEKQEIKKSWGKKKIKKFRKSTKNRTSEKLGN